MPSSFLRSSDLTGVRALGVGNSKPLLASDEAISKVVSHIPELQHFFAEPTITFDENGDPKSAKWYTEFEHEARRVEDLTGQKRERALENLNSKLTVAAQHFDDPEIGNLLAAMLNIASPKSIYFVGTQPVLTDWATIPVDLKQTGLTDRLGELFPATFATSTFADPPRAFVGVESNLAELGSDAEQPEGSHDEEAKAKEEETAQHGGVVADAGIVSAENLQARNIHINATPIYHRTWFRNLLSCFFVLLIILLLWWLLFARPGGILVRSSNTTIPMHGSIIEGLQNERDRLNRLLEDPCTTEASSALNQGFTGPLAPQSPSQNGTTPIPPAPGEPRYMMSPPILAHYFERSIALIIAERPEGGYMMGSGFFISRDTIVTNRHVVEQADSSKIAVTSEVIGSIQSTTILAMTSDSEIGTSDYAVLKLGAPVDVDPVPLSTAAGKLNRVISVGYPGYLTNMDPNLHSLLEGDLSAAPETVFTSGEISVIQGGGGSPPIIIHTADMSQGNSGGPLVDMCGRVLGVNTFIGQDDLSGRRGLFALGASDLMRFIDQFNVPYQRIDGACEAEPPAATGQEEG